ncbi:hypothetical protein AALP_AA5G254600 [Arabis alpina]|uniref:SKP1-like protein n=1 Tax=Arabis alpina TaxID=50452 RepID=A0A087GZA7_ARAAL|nr:hypothetical protein AALP_AA5G254600 [Arabis alpina]
MASENPDFVVVAPVVGNGGAGSSNGNEEHLVSELSKMLVISKENPNNKIVLMSSDGASFEVKEAVAREFEIVAHMIEDNCAGKAIPIANVTGDILSKVIEYCEKHVEEEKGKGVLIDYEEEEAKEKKLKIWDTEFMKQFDMEMVFHLILAANYLNIQGLLDLTCLTVADHVKEMKVEQVREFFNIENDFTPEEEAEILKENQWDFGEPSDFQS